MVQLITASKEDLQTIWKMQVEAMEEAERIHGKNGWCLDTILQEAGNLHLYEKMGYHRTGQIEKINDRMDIVFYEKE